MQLLIRCSKLSYFAVNHINYSINHALRISDHQLDEILLVPGLAVVRALLNVTYCDDRLMEPIFLLHPRLILDVGIIKVQFEFILDVGFIKVQFNNTIIDGYEALNQAIY